MSGARGKRIAPSFQPGTHSYRPLSLSFLTLIVRKLYGYVGKARDAVAPARAGLALGQNWVSRSARRRRRSVSFGGGSSYGNRNLGSGEGGIRTLATGLTP